jgi:hypothetical protein
VSESHLDDSFKQLQSRFVGQLDSLVPFLALAHREIFGVLSSQYADWYPDERQATLPDNFQEYCHQVAHAAFLLGYSYAEAFITDVIWEVYSARRDLLPPERALRFGEVLPLANFEDVVRRMIDSTVGDMNSLEKKIHHLETRLGLTVEQSAQLLDSHVAWNALVHNAGRVNWVQTDSSRWQAGDTVRLSADEVHEFGTMVREYAEQLCLRAQRLCAKR